MKLNCWKKKNEKKHANNTLSLFSKEKWVGCNDRIDRFFEKFIYFLLLKFDWKIRQKGINESHINEFIEMCADIFVATVSRSPFIQFRYFFVIAISAAFPI